MRKPVNKKGSRGYGKFIDSYRKTKPEKTHNAHTKKHKRKIKKAGTDFAVIPPSKIVSKFAEKRDEKDSSTSETMRPTFTSTTVVSKAVAGTPGYDEWLEKFRASMAAKHGGTATAPKPYGKPGQSHQAILTEARGGNVDTMHHPDAHNLRDAEGMSILHHLARRGKSEILTHEHAHTTKDKLQRTPLHLLAERGVPDIVGHPHAANTFDVLGNTPLHYLAQSKHPSVLDHPDISTVRNLRGSTPLHSAAYAKIPGVEKHPDFDLVRDNAGRTPKHIFDGISGLKPVEKGYVTFEKAFFGDIKKSDPIKKEYTFKDIDICIEWPKGSIRKYGKDNSLDGKKMKADYGYIKNTTSPDHEEIDVYVGSRKDSDKVFLLLQKPTPYDIEHGFSMPEEKYMLGFNSKEEAEKAYKGSMPAKWFESIEEINFHYMYKKIRTNEIKKAVSNQTPGYATLGTTPPGVEDGFEKSAGPNREPKWTASKDKEWGNRLKEAQINLKKDINSLPQAAAEQGSRQRGPVYSFDQSNSVQKGVNKKRLKMAETLLDISKANAFVGNGGFVARPHRKLTVEDAKKLDLGEDSQPFKSVKKSLSTMFKSETVSGGLMKYEKLNKIYRGKYRKDRLMDEREDMNKANLEKVTKSLNSIKKNIDGITRLVFEIN